MGAQRAETPHEHAAPVHCREQGFFQRSCTGWRSGAFIGYGSSVVVLCGLYRQQTQAGRRKRRDACGF
jgi:hypothetical protein